MVARLTRPPMPCAEREAGRRRPRSHEGAAADFADDQPAPDELGVDPRRRGHRDAAGVGELALRGQPIARPQAAGAMSACSRSAIVLK